MEIKRMSLGPLGTNCYLLLKDKDALIIDPGGDADKIIEFFNHNDYRPSAILLTHAHFDHIGAVDEIRNTYKIDVYLHGNERDWLRDPSKNGSNSFIGNPISTDIAEHDLTEGSVQIKTFLFDVIHTPGHSPGSVCFVFKNDKITIGGDVLFNQGVGRTDLPGGSMDQLKDSIRNKLYLLDDDMIIYPGHGPETTIGNEKKFNPFVTQY